MTDVTIGDGVNSIGDDAFYGCSSLTSLKIGKSVTSIGANAFDGCSSLKSCYCYAEKPPKVIASDWYSTDSFLQYGNKATLYVPLRCGSIYKKSTWNRFFTNIVEMD